MQEEVKAERWQDYEAAAVPTILSSGADAKPASSNHVVGFSNIVKPQSRVVQSYRWEGISCSYGKVRLPLSIPQLA